MNEVLATVDLEMEENFAIVKCKATVIEVSDHDFNWGKDIDSVVQRLEGRALIISFSKVVILSSAALQHLIQLYFRAKEQHIKFGLCGMNSGMAETFKITRLDTLFLIADTIDELKTLLGK
ncbi:MAG: STAS domain-containing protein [Planctomycetia bacterium]|nr:STAS domain-containing protein [Planctomycetia bacterium]